MDAMLRACQVTSCLMFLLALAGCGQSGALYMPGNPSQMTVPAAPEASAADGEDDDNGDSE